MQSALCNAMLQQYDSPGNGIANEIYSELNQ